MFLLVKLNENFEGHGDMTFFVGESAMTSSEIVINYCE